MDLENWRKMETLLSLPLRMCAAIDFHRIVLKAAGCEGHLRARVRDQGAAECRATFCKLKTGPFENIYRNFANVVHRNSTDQ